MSTALRELLMGSSQIKIVLPAGVIPSGTKVSQVLDRGFGYILEREITVYSEDRSRQTISGLFLINPSNPTSINSVAPDRQLYVEMKWSDLAELADEYGNRSGQ